MASCLHCGWRPIGNLPNVVRLTNTLTATFVLLTATTSCAVTAYSGKYGDELGYGLMAVIESVVLIVTVLWLSAQVAVTSQLPRYQSKALIRACAGAGLGTVAVGLALHGLSGRTSNPVSLGLLGITGAALLLTNIRLLRRNR